MDYDQVARGIVSFIDKEIFPRMNTLQEIAGRIAVSRLYDNREAIKNTIKNNAILKSIFFSSDGEDVDLDILLRDIKSQINNKGKIEFEIPMFGKFTFVASDVDSLHRYIMEA